MVNAVRNKDLETLKALQRDGRTMDASNKFGESVMHMACRRGANNILEFLLKSGVDINRSDDYGRTPLHDACWTSTPNFDIVRLLLDSNRVLVAVADSRGALPLSYIPQDHWPEWCSFLFRQK